MLEKTQTDCSLSWVMHQMNIGLYFAVVLIWGTTWIAIAAQHGEFSPVIGVFWRFMIATVLLFVGLIISKKFKTLSARDHLFCLLQGLCIFGFNFICFYTAVGYINSGLESVIFSMAVLFNAINSRLFFKQQISAWFIPAAFLGLAGMIALFWQSLVSTAIHWQTLWGIGLSILGTFGFSLGNMISIRHQRQQLDVFTTNAYGMLYGTVIMGMLGLILQQNFFPMVSLTAFIGLGYLAVFGTVVGFTLYFILIGRIGAGRAAYSTLLFPLVALSISTVWESYQWTLSSVLGVILILLGNYVLFSQPQWLSGIFSKKSHAM